MMKSDERTNDLPRRRRWLRAWALPRRAGAARRGSHSDRCSDGRWSTRRAAAGGPKQLPGDRADGFGALGSGTGERALAPTRPPSRGGRTGDTRRQHGLRARRPPPSVFASVDEHPPEAATTSRGSCTRADSGPAPSFSVEQPARRRWRRSSRMLPPAGAPARAPLATLVFCWCLSARVSGVGERGRGGGGGEGPFARRARALLSSLVWFVSLGARDVARSANARGREFRASETRAAPSRARCARSRAAACPGSGAVRRAAPHPLRQNSLGARTLRVPYGVSRERGRRSALRGPWLPARAAAREPIARATHARARTDERRPLIPSETRAVPAGLRG